MKKEAYFKLMGLQKKAADTPVIAPKGYQQLPVFPKNPSAQTFLQFAKEQAGKPETMDQFRKLIRNVGQTGAAPGELSFWQQLWETIKSWFGSDTAKKALARSAEVKAAREKAGAGLKKFMDEKLETPSSDAEKLLHNTNMADLISRAVRRDAMADFNVESYGDNLTPEQKKQLKDYYIGRGEQNRMQPQATPIVNMPGFIPKEKQEEVNRRGLLMANATPSYREQLMGDTGIA